jgi:integrase
MARSKKRKGLSYVTGDKGTNRVRLFADPRRNGTLFLEYRDEVGKKKSLALGHDDFTRGKVKANELAAALLKQEGPRTDELTLKALFANYEIEVTAGRLKKTPARISHGARTRRLFESCWGSSTLVKHLDVNHWNAFVHQRRSGALCPPGKQRKKVDPNATAIAKPKPLRPVRNRIIEYDLKYFLAVCHWAERVIVKGKPLLERTPFKGLPLPREVSPSRPIVSAKEYTSLREAASKLGGSVPLFVVLAHDTGHRANAIRQLRWSDVDTAKGEILWRATTDKSAFEHRSPVTKTALDALKAERVARARIGDGFVFPADDEGKTPVDRYAVIHWWTQLERAAGIAHREGLGWHGFRRKFANDAKRAGASLVDTARVAGWKGTETLLRVYQQPDDASMKSVLENMERLRASGE